jgi:hypothetical protein
MPAASSSALKAGFTVELAGLTAKTDEDGYFELNIPPSSDKITIKISKPGYLSLTKEISITGDKQLSTGAAPIKLWAGDIDNDGVGDGAINISDIMELVKSFNR